MPTRRETGEFCWINMITRDSERACAFYAALLGWQFTVLPGTGFGINVGGHDIGGLFDQSHPRTPPGTPASIGVMVKIDDADAIAARVRSLGGRARDPFDVGAAGRLAVCSDPNGAEFDVWQPKQMQGTDVDPAVHGAPSWFETLTTDADRAITFYESLFGWRSSAVPAGESTYYDFLLGDVQVAGLMEITPEMEIPSSRWGVYFTVDDVDATERQAVELGASLDIPTTDIPGVGRYCTLTSPQRVSFSVITYE